MTLSWYMGLFKLAAYLVLKPAFWCITSEGNLTVLYISGLDHWQSHTWAKKLFTTDIFRWKRLLDRSVHSNSCTTLSQVFPWAEFFKMPFKLAEIKHRGLRVPIMTRLDFNMQVFGNRFDVFRIPNWYWCVMIHITWGLLNCSLIWENILECFLAFLHSNNEPLLHAVGPTF